MVSLASTHGAPARINPPAHIVDVLIEERAPKLAGSPAWPLLRPALYGLLHYANARRMADLIGPLGGAAALEAISDLLQVQTSVRGLERLPAVGRAVIVINHPTGIADGIAVYDALKGARSDLVFYANSDAHRVCPRFDEVLIPVEWVEAKRTRERTRLTLQMTRAAMEAERALAVFPSGRLARRQPDGTLADPPWMPTAVSVARKYGAPILPIHLAGPWSAMFHFFNRFSQELRDITLFHELLNKQGGRFALTIGPAVDPETLPGDPAEATAALKAYVERVLPQHPDQPFA